MSELKLYLNEIKLVLFEEGSLWRMHTTGYYGNVTCNFGVVSDADAADAVVSGCGHFSGASRPMTANRTEVRN
jgi:hypothetical protein